MDSFVDQLRSKPAVLVAAFAVVIVVTVTVLWRASMPSKKVAADDSRTVPADNKAASAVAPPTSSSTRSAVMSETSSSTTTTAATAKKKKKKKKAKPAKEEVDGTATKEEGEKAAVTEVNGPSSDAASGKKSKKKNKKAASGNTKPTANNASNKKGSTKKNGGNETLASGNTGENDTTAEDPVISTSTKNAPPADQVPTKQQWQQQLAADLNDGWEVEGPKKKKRGGGGGANKSKAASGASAAAAASANAETRHVVTIEAKHVGIIIGPKGATMQSVQSATNTQLEINAGKPGENSNRKGGAAPPAAVVITGKASDVKKAEQAIRELCTKGYTTATQEKGFTEQSVSVHPRVLTELVGPGGTVIRALQEGCNVKVTIPPTDWRPGDDVKKARPVRVGVAGSRDACTKAKMAIQSIVRYHHSEVTHPGLVHEEVDVPVEYYHAIIGPKGSEIRHVRGNYGCDVHIPNADSYTQNVIVVGKPAMVTRAVAHLENLMARASEMRERTYDDDYY